MSIKKQRVLKALLLFFVFVLMVTVMVITPFTEGPDEEMRYQMPYYMFEHGKLPTGGDPEIRNEAWGLSYAYQPVTAYMFQAAAMRIAYACGVRDCLFMTARFVNVLFSVGTVSVCFAIGEMLFPGIYVWLFVMLVSLLPEFLFVSGYVNSDTFGIFCVSLIILSLLKGRESRWSVRSCVRLGIALGLGAISYYNVFGVLLSAVIYCILSAAADETIEHRGRFILGRAGIAASASLAVCGWWFIRNAILYNGDFIGESASRAEAEQYAADWFKPSLIENPKNLGYSLRYMLTDMNWMKNSCMSYVAVFSTMRLLAGQWVYSISRFLADTFLLCWLADLFCLIRRKIRADKQTVLFYASLVAMCILTAALSIYYSYASDFQPQGRYLLPMLIPSALLCTKGLSVFSGRISETAGKIFAASVIIFMIVISIYSVYGVMLPEYRLYLQDVIYKFILIIRSII